MAKSLYFYIFCFLLIKFTINQEKDKIGFIFLHDESSSYDKNFIDAANETCNELGVEAVFKTNIPEGDECYDASKRISRKWM